MNELSRLAVLDANYSNLQRQVQDHEKRDEDRFDRMFTFITVMKEDLLESIGNSEDKLMEKFANLDEKMDLSVDPLKGKVDILWDEKNKQDGAFKASKFIWGGISGLAGGVLALAVEWWKR